MDRYERILARIKALNASGWALCSTGQGMGRRVECEFSFQFIYHSGMPCGEVSSNDLLDALESACERAERIETDWRSVEASRR
jgi:hypothetical protein